MDLPPGSPLRLFAGFSEAGGRLEPKNPKKAGTRGWSRQALAGCPDKSELSKLQNFGVKARPKGSKVSQL
jgi:hypothetical protein